MKLNMKLLFVIIATIFLSLNYIIALNSKSQTNIKIKKEDTLEDEFDENNSSVADTRKSQSKSGKNKKKRRR